MSQKVDFVRFSGKLEFGVSANSMTETIHLKFA
jgi:hypothetical protein